MAEHRLANIRRAREEGLIDQQQASELTRAALGEQNTAQPTSPLSQEPAVDRAITNAANSGAPIEVTRTSASGTERVSVNDNATASLRQPLQSRCGFVSGSTVVTETDLRDAVVRITQNETPNWRNGATVVRENENDRFGHLVRYWLGSEAAIRPSTLAVLQTNAIDPARNYRALLPAAVDPALNADVVTVRGELLVGAPNATTPANLDARIDRSLLRARSSRLDTGAFTAWSAVFVVNCVRSAAIDLDLESDASGTHQGIDLLLRASFRHAEYVLEAFNRRRRGQRGTYHAFATDERVVQVGDIIVLDRQANRIQDVVRFNRIPNTLGGGREMHSDIVVSIDETNQFAETLGGNVGESVRRRRYPLTNTGHLLVQQDQMFTQEQDDGTIANPPVVTAAALSDLSTGRIFTLLSLVEDCFVIPGQPVNGGILV